MSEPPTSKKRRADSSSVVPPPASLAAEQKVRPITSCLQCRNRKVKCDKGTPCRNCVRRKEPDLCQYTDNADHADSSGIPSGQSSGGKYTAYLKLSASRSLEDSSHGLSHEHVIRPILEDDAEAPDSFDGIDGRGPVGGAVEDEIDLLPREVINVYEAFILRAHQFVPIVLSVPRLADCAYRFAGGDTSGRKVHVTDKDDSMPLDQRALLFVVLASGAQYSDLPRVRRMILMRFFSSSAFVCLRAANFLSRPTAEVIQTLLVLGHLGQNNFRCHAAWSMLGLITRLASSIGIHQGLYKHRPPPTEEWKLRLLDSMGWQDTLLSICTGNVPTIVVERSNEIDDDLDYPAAMRYLCAKTAQILWHRRTYGEALRSVLDQVVQARDFFRKVASRVNATQATGEHSTRHLQRIAFRVHAAFTVSYLCKPAFKSPDKAQMEKAIVIKLMEISTAELIGAARDYSALLRLTVIAVRSWSLLHSGMGSALMLGLLGEFKQNREARRLAHDILENLSAADIHGSPTGNEWDKKIVHKLQALYEEAASDESLSESQPSEALSMPESQSLSLDDGTGLIHGQPQQHQQQQQHFYDTTADSLNGPITTLPIPPENFRIPDLESFDTLFTQDWLPDFDANIF